MSGVMCVAPWFGSARMVGQHAGKALKGCEWIGVPFAGGMAELIHFDARTMLISDLHWQVLNLAETAAHRIYGPQLYRRLNRILFHEATLSHAQMQCLDYWGVEPPDEIPCLEAAVDYFVAVWMNRSALAGTDGEFRGGLPVRWDAGGGDSAVRYRSAIKALIAFRRTLQRCNFVMLDAFLFLDKVHDRPGHGLYIDPPWLQDGGGYKHKFDEAAHRRLAPQLAAFKQTRVVVRAGDHPLVRELYPADLWDWQMMDGRTQANKTKSEVLLIRNGTETFKLK